MNVPNILTVFRLILIPIFILVFFSSLQHSLILSIAIFVLAGLTDVLDGYIARKYELVTDWGTVVDPLADKLILLTVLTCLVVSNYIPLWILIIVLAKEALMIIMGVLLYNKGTVIPSNIFGKATTCFFYLAILIFSFNKDIGLYLIYLSVGATILALISYGIGYQLNHKGSLKNNKK